MKKDKSILDLEDKLSNIRDVLGKDGSKIFVGLILNGSGARIVCAKKSKNKGENNE